MALVGVDSKRFEVRDSSILQQMPWLTQETHALRWMDHCGSEITHHDGRCCVEAREWFLGWARSMEAASLVEGGMRAPTWLSDRFEWGPSAWPIPWCELIEQKVIDCGVFAALAREVFLAQGTPAFPAQAVIRYSDRCTRHWQQYWKEGDPGTSRELFPWVGSELVYHEICVVESKPGVARFYDSTWGNWYIPQSRLGYGSLVALRAFCSEDLQWGKYQIRPLEWLVIS